MYLSHLFPSPRYLQENHDRRFTFGGAVTAAVSGLGAPEAERVRYLWRRFSCEACELTLTERAPSCGQTAYTFSVGTASAALCDGDSYAIAVDEGGVSVVGRDASGLLDGIKTLVQLIYPVELAEGREAFYMSAAEIHDAPDVGFRGIHLCVFPGTPLYQLTQSIHLAGFLKLTHVILEFWGTFRYRCQPAMSWEDRSYTREELRPLVELIRSYGMEIIPMVNHFGHASQARSRNGRHVALNRNPRLARLYEPGGWTWCLSNPDAYGLLGEMRAELEEWAGPGGYFHLGFDEADTFATCDLCRCRVSHELLAEYINRLTEDVCRRGRRPILWHDMFLAQEGLPPPRAPETGWVVANGHIKETHKALDSLDRRIIMADWQYGYGNGYNPSTPIFIEKGFDTLVCPWDDHENIRSLSADVKKYGAMGIILTTWHHLPAFLSTAAYWSNCAWTAGEKAFGGGYAENASILRTLYDAEGSFERSGWDFCEVEKEYVYRN